MSRVKTKKKARKKKVTRDGEPQLPKLKPPTTLSECNPPALAKTFWF